MYGSRSSLARPAALAFATLALAGTAGLAFAGWLEQGPELFLVLAEQGLAWCF